MILEKPIIFLGVSRSGTTIISEIIFQHQALAWPSNYQTRYPDKVWVNKIRPLLDNNAWSLRGQKPQLNKIPIYNRYAFKPAEAYSFWNYISHLPVKFSHNFLLHQRADSNDKQRIRKIFEKLVKYQKRKRLAFKITGPGRVSYLHSIFPDAIFIEITRDPWANIRSLLKVPFWKSRGMHQIWWQGAYTENEEKIAQSLKNRPALITAMQYCKIRQTTAEEATMNKVELHSFAYDDFIKNPKQVLSQILEVAGLQNCSSIDKYLDMNKIYNRNENSSEFFTSEDQSAIQEMLKDYL
ncbi:MAG: sulfotransferase [Parafilimonas sp.]